MCNDMMSKKWLAFILITWSYQIHGIPDATLMMDTGQLIKQSGYTLEEIEAVTPDGYKLKMQRIPGGKEMNKNSSLPPVLLMHGLGGNSKDFVILGPKKSLGYLLADSGYDVFLGNMRFNMYGSHANISREDPKYWDFSLDEPGQYDIPSMIEKVLQVTGAPGLHYIGYSMGSTTYFMACSARPDLAKKIVSYVGLAPAVYMDNFQSIAKTAFEWKVPKLLKEQKINYFAFGQIYRQVIDSEFCSKQNRDVCLSLIFQLTGEDYQQIDWNVFHAVLSNFQTVSVKQVTHYGQLALTDRLMHFNHGKLKNLEKYGVKFPPEYSIKSNKAPVALFYGNNDRLTPANKVVKLHDTLKGTNQRIELHQVSWYKFTHMDFVVARNVDLQVNRYVLNFINQLSNVKM